ncbi:hypothetical protein L3Y34_014641 [Caenorhabditis briggsae]|uniref:Uncharacterized protein n=2 Tax=Caenorhabditis briggsae TaxID=6238 RepID=A0AAE9DSF3_CAEBR|nr:hypothetical protein L3Y34_014641 [Caenorhabditis briggsae]
MRFIYFILLPVIVMADKNNTAACFRDLVVLKNISNEFILLYATAGGNVLLLILNSTILFAVLGYMKPVISEIRKQTFIIIDNILRSYIPAEIREVVGCKPEVTLDGGEEKKEKKTAGKAKKRPSKPSKTSKTSTGKTGASIATTGGTAAASE